ncbi:M14 family zinc carboxypeptidase [Mesonia aestuariivivens]|uniref:Peptidase M14 n=1 Tax=Mesonia aestuariivivens TaxID=2796128 RepID=A0ABS6VZL0_9FLAO|nr:M14 family zinc carboxypeptidase [Mesonia aestuariivivens]MBW2960701.1 peptidase M14 [Mesonia aestuariivivens]
METTRILNNYEKFKVEEISKRYLSYKHIVDYLKKLPTFMQLKVEGKSVLNEAIYSVELGNGPKKVLMWSQMHGNESTTTKAILDLLEFLVTQQNPDYNLSILASCTLKIIVVLNPDGLKNYTRVNANKVDLNRDAYHLTQPESKILRNVFDEFSPHYAFNLHDQRTIFSAGNQNKPATVSFLAPAYNLERNINKTREKAMQIIIGMSECLQKHIPYQIGRYDDAFNINCVGDNFQNRGASTILFEAGHYANDYEREETRKYIFMSLYASLLDIATDTYKNRNVNDYNKIPENKKLFYDILIKNAQVNGKQVDVAIQYEEYLKNNRLQFLPKLQGIGDYDGFYAHQTVNAKNKVLRINSVKNFENETYIEEIRLNNEIFSMKLTNS